MLDHTIQSLCDVLPKVLSCSPITLGGLCVAGAATFLYFLTHRRDMLLVSLCALAYASVPVMAAMK